MSCLRMRRYEHGAGRAATSASCRTTSGRRAHNRAALPRARAARDQPDGIAGRRQDRACSRPPRARSAGRRLIGALAGDLATDNDARRLAAAGIRRRIDHHRHRPAISTPRWSTSALHHLPWRDLDYLFIENVGNLVCPAVYDLGQDANVVALSVTEGEDKPLKYPTMFHKADLVLLTKIDLLPHLPEIRIDADRRYARDASCPSRDDRRCRRRPARASTTGSTGCARQKRGRARAPRTDRHAGTFAMSDAHRVLALAAVSAGIAAHAGAGSLGAVCRAGAGGRLVARRARRASPRSAASATSRCRRCSACSALFFGLELLRLVGERHGGGRRAAADRVRPRLRARRAAPRGRARTA